MGRDISHRYACICHAESQSRSCPVRASPSYALQHMHVKWHARRNVHRRRVPLGMSFFLRLFAGRYRNRRSSHHRSGRSRSHPWQHGGWRDMPACGPTAATSGAALPWETSARLPASSKEAPPCAAASGTSCQDCAGGPGDSLPEQIRSDVADSHPGYSPILPAEVSRPGHPSLPRRSRKPIWASPRPAGPSAASATMTDRRPASSSSMLTAWHT